MSLLGKPEKSKWIFGVEWNKLL